VTLAIGEGDALPDGSRVGDGCPDRCWSPLARRPPTTGGRIRQVIACGFLTAKFLCGDPTMFAEPMAISIDEGVVAAGVVRHPTGRDRSYGGNLCGSQAAFVGRNRTGLPI